MYITSLQAKKLENEPSEAMQFAFGAGIIRSAFCRWSAQQEGFNVANRALDDIEVELSEAFIFRGVLADPALASSVTEIPVFASKPGCLPESGVEDGSCLKGFFVAIGLEAAMALSIYGLWQVWHILR
jgi:hypothetical protein